MPFHIYSTTLHLFTHSTTMAPLRSVHGRVLVAALFFFFCQLTANAKAQRSPPPKTLVAPITKDPKTLLYTVELRQRTPLKKLHLVLDTTRDYTTVRCDARSYVSSSYAPVACSDTVCKSYAYAGCGTCYGSKKGPGCNNNTCVVPGTGSSSFELARDVVALRSARGPSPGRSVNISGVVFACATGNSALGGLPAGAAGFAGLTASTLALPAQLASQLKFSRKFGICLSASKGVAFFGDGPYFVLPPPGKDISTGLLNTTLIKNPSYTDDFYVGIVGINVDGVHVPIDTSKLAINSRGRGGTKLDMLEPYTKLATSLYTSLVNTFVDVAKRMNITRVASVAPFGACFSTKGVAATRGGVGVATIGLIFQNNAQGDSTIWRIFGANSMVQVSQSVMCLGFVDGGADPVTAVVIGTHQMQNNLLVFDLATSTLGFSALFFQMTTCSNYNFTSST